MPNKILIVIEGGTLKNVFTTNPETEVYLLDYDDVDALIRHGYLEENATSKINPLVIGEKEMNSLIKKSVADLVQ